MMLRIRSNLIYIQSFHSSLYLRHYYLLLRYSHLHPSKKQNRSIRNIVSYLHLSSKLLSQSIRTYFWICLLKIHRPTISQRSPFLQKLEKWPQDSGLTRTSIKSSVSPANIQNFIQSITFALEKQPQQPEAEFLTRLLESPLFITWLVGL